MSELSTSTLDALVNEAALRYYPPDKLAALFDLSEDDALRILEHPKVRSRVSRKRRELDDTGEAVPLIARKLVREILTDVALIARDDQAAPADRLSAVKLLSQLGTLLSNDNAAGGVTIHINGAEELRALRADHPWSNPAAGASAPSEFHPVTIEVDSDPPDD